MEIRSERLVVEKTARYFEIGDTQEPINEVVFVLHGYGMQASEFIKNFEAISQPGRLIIAPEGLSRFYKKAFSGDVVASWMTKEDRLHEIEDYIKYLDKLYFKVVGTGKFKITVLGFSQGATTASRWVMNGSCRIDDFVIWCGEFAQEKPINSGQQPRLWHVYALKDEFITMDRFNKQSEFLKNSGFELNEVAFDGGHTIDQPTLLKVWKGMTP